MNILYFLLGNFRTCLLSGHDFFIVLLADNAKIYIYKKILERIVSWKVGDEAIGYFPSTEVEVLCEFRHAEIKRNLRRFND